VLRAAIRFVRVTEPSDDHAGARLDTGSKRGAFALSVDLTPYAADDEMEDERGRAEKEELHGQSTAAG
jgi:hypothetical protein